MLTVPALKVQQFTQEFYLLNLAAADVERLVRFEVLGDAGLEGQAAARRRGRAASLVNWSEIERQVHTSDKAYQRPILRKKIEELTAHYRQCREDGTVPAIPGAVLLTTEEPVAFATSGPNPFVGLVQLAEAEGTLRVLDGQHRLLALAALLLATDASDEDRAANRMLQVPAILFVGMPPPAVVEMFVTINSKHTRLNPSLLYSLKGRQLYSDPLDARVHDAIKALNEKDGSSLRGHIRMLGVGPGKVAQAALAHEMQEVVRAIRAEHGGQQVADDFLAHLDRFYVSYFKEVARVFEGIWTSKHHSVRTAIALRAFVQASRAVAPRVWAAGGDARAAIRALVAPWSHRVGDERFETAGPWRAKSGGGGNATTRLLARELVAGLGDASAATVSP